MTEHDLGRWVVTIVLFLAIAALAGIAPLARADAPATQPASPSPDPKLMPADVVKIVVEALLKNDGQDTGIRTTWKFASPANKELTGPVERFIPMVKSPAYAPLIAAKSADYSDPQIRGNQAVQVVVLTAADGTKTAYVFQLSRQSEGDLKDCWMTDAVFPVKAQAKPQPDDGDALPA